MEYHTKNSRFGENTNTMVFMEQLTDRNKNLHLLPF